MACFSAVSEHDWRRSTLIERGQVRPLVAEVLPLEEVGKPMSGWTPDTGAGKQS